MCAYRQLCLAPRPTLSCPLVLLLEQQDGDSNLAPLSPSPPPAELLFRPSPHSGAQCRWRIRGGDRANINTLPRSPAPALSILPQEAGAPARQLSLQVVQVVRHLSPVPSSSFPPSPTLRASHTAPRHLAASMTVQQQHATSQARSAVPMALVDGCGVWGSLLSPEMVRQRWCRHPATTWGLEEAGNVPQSRRAAPRRLGRTPRPGRCTPPTSCRSAG